LGVFSQDLDQFVKGLVDNGFQKLQVRQGEETLERFHLDRRQAPFHKNIHYKLATGPKLNETRQCSSTHTVGVCLE